MAAEKQTAAVPSEEGDVISTLGVVETDAYEALGGAHPAQMIEDRLYTKEWKAQVDAMEKVPVYIPGDFAEFVQVNGLSFIINPEQIVMVPSIVKEVLDNKRLGERAINQNQARLKRLMSPNGINAIPEYHR
jgi:hypothetical protein